MRSSSTTGARRALVERKKSLLPAGVVSVEGRFVDGDTVEVRGTDGNAFARGMVFVDAGQLRKVMGMQTGDLPEGVVHEVIHRDDLVVLPLSGAWVRSPSAGASLLGLGAGVGFRLCGRRGRARRTAQPPDRCRGRARSAAG